MTDTDIEEMFSRLRWPPNGEPRCPKCGSEARYEIQCRSFRNSALWRCANPPCRTDFSLLSRTLLANGKLPLRSYLLAFEAFANRTTWKCGNQIQRAAKMNSKAGYLLSLKLHSLLKHENERVTTEELLRRALHTKPQPEHWRRYRPVATWPPRPRV